MTRPKTKNFTYFTGKKYDGMMSRCYKKSNRSFKNYGGKGVKVCSAWIKDIYAFRAWIIKELETKKLTEEYLVNNPKKLQVHRKDSNGHYTPENCVLVSAQENIRAQKGKRKIFISAEGEKIHV